MEGAFLPPLGIEGNAEFSISPVLNTCRLCFSLHNDIFIYHVAELFKRYEQKCKYRPVFYVVTLWQQAVWLIMADVPRIGINSPIVVNFGSMTEHTL